MSHRAFTLSFMAFCVLRQCAWIAADQFWEALSRLVGSLPMKQIAKHILLSGQTTMIPPAVGRHPVMRVR